MSIRLSKCAVAYNSASLLKQAYKDDALSQVLCLHCGVIPITLMSDGNAKNSIFLNGGSESYIFDRNDDSEIPSLAEFLKMCILNLTGSALFQNYPKKKINIFKIPPLIADILTTQVKNRECLKKSLSRIFRALELYLYANFEQIIA